MRQFQLVRRVRHARDPLDVAKALLQTSIGRRSLRGTRRALRRFGLDPQELHAHRLGRRLGVAPGAGYEAAAVAAAQRGMYLDVPLYRADCWSPFDPIDYRHPVYGTYKAVAWSYMDQVAPQLVAVRARKVTFDSTLRGLFQPGYPDRDKVDSNAACVHATSDGYRSWRSQFEHRVHHEDLKR